MRSKDEILKKQYEMRYSSQKYEGSQLDLQYSPIAKFAMDEHAEQVAIDFSKWKHENTINRYGITDVTMQLKRRGQHYFYAKDSEWKTDDQLFELYKQQQNENTPSSSSAAD